MPIVSMNLRGRLGPMVVITALGVALSACGGAEAGTSETGSGGTDASGKQMGGYAPDGTPVLYWVVTTPGPYQDKMELRGIQFKNADGSWGLRR